MILPELAIQGAELLEPAARAPAGTLNATLDWQQETPRQADLKVREADCGGSADTLPETRRPIRVR